MRSAFHIGKIAGIPVKLHITFLAIIPVIAYLFAGFSELLGGKLYGFGAVEPLLVRWIYSFVFTIFLFVCVGLHELGHSFVAMRYGVKIKSITLYIFGGVAAMEDIPKDPNMEFRMAIAGPTVSGILGLGCVLFSFQSAAMLGEFHPFTTFLWTLGLINLILMAFNLIPAFPMDGGRVFRAWLATRMSYVAATKQAASVGKMFAILMGLLGLLSLNFFLVIIAFFVYIGASEEERATSVSVSLEGIHVRDIMSTDVRTISSSMILSELVDYMFHEKHRSYPVVQDGQMIGFVTITDVQKVPEDKRNATTVGDIMVKKIYVIEPHVDASEAMKKMAERRIRRLPVMEDGRLVGILSRSDLLRAIEICSGW
ncbi:MAG: M50 family metallopeptidase [Methanotrichaceae archaeon]